MEFRSDDLRDTGFCPACARRLTNLTNEGKGWCPEHGWVFADYTQLRTYEVNAWVTVRAKDEDDALVVAREIIATHPSSEVTLHIDDGAPEDVTEEWEKDQ